MRFFYFLFMVLFLLTPQTSSSETSIDLTQHLGKIESNKWNLYFTPLAQADLNYYQTVHTLFKSRMEIITVALVNQQDEIIRVVTPPPPLIFPLQLESQDFILVNQENTMLTEFWSDNNFTEEQKESYVLRFIQNSLQNPLGSMLLIQKEGTLYLQSTIDDESILTPLSFVLQKKRFLFKEEDLDSLFRSTDWRVWSENEFTEKLKKNITKTKTLPIKKGWFLFCTETSSQLTPEFNRWLGFIRSRELNLAYSFIIHSHPYPQQWKRLTRFPNKLPDWATDFDFVLLPSSTDIVGNLEGIIPFSGIYSYDPDSQKPFWAFYATDSELLDLSNKMNLILSSLKEKELSQEDYLKGKKTVTDMIQKRSKFNFTPISLNTNSLNKKRIKKELKQLRQLSRKAPANKPWIQDWTRVLAQKNRLMNLKESLNTWEYFSSLHPFPKELRATLFFISNQLRIRINELELAQSFSKKDYHYFTIDEVLLQELEDEVKKNRDFSSQQDLLNQLLKILLASL